MKNQGVISAVVGGTFFAVPYLGLAVPFVPALVIGAAAFGASELVFAGTKKKNALEDLENSNKRLYNQIVKANKSNAFILSMIPKIDDEAVKANLKEIYSTNTKIINVVTKNNAKVKSINNYFDYYLPVLVKIVSRYDEIENQNLTSSEIKKFMKSTAEMIEEVNDSFKKILSSLYQEEIVDTDVEMKVFNQMLKADGFNDKGLLKKEDKDE